MLANAKRLCIACVLSIHILRCRLQKQYCAGNKLFVTVYFCTDLPNSQKLTLLYAQDNQM